MILKVGKSYKRVNGSNVKIVDKCNNNSFISNTGLYYTRSGKLISNYRGIDLVEEIE